MASAAVHVQRSSSSRQAGGSAVEAFGFSQQGSSIPGSNVEVWDRARNPRGEGAPRQGPAMPDDSIGDPVGTMVLAKMTAESVFGGDSSFANGSQRGGNPAGAEMPTGRTAGVISQQHRNGPRHSLLSAAAASGDAVASDGTEREAKPLGHTTNRHHDPSGARAAQSNRGGTLRDAEASKFAQSMSHMVQGFQNEAISFFMTAKETATKDVVGAYALREEGWKKELAHMHQEVRE
eukprot:GHVU01076945.1.p2 GENE.GHVU01076945.1~~GHVU01076945.1.p2  ORF type:complete len:235 (-),score=38.20 GHVU01076945.1:3500-4204(-)